jgi:creatinine amidohydrolase/Fe(II)-dependent formamide hydrolase-like protein
MIRRVISGFLVIGFSIAFVGCQPAGEDRTTPGGRVLKLEELSFTDIDKLDRAKSIFFLTFGNLEEHGPHLPVGSDYFHALGIRDGLVNRLRVAHPDYAFVLAPVVPLGEGGANDAAGQPEHIGTFAVRYQTLRDVAIDLGASVARKGFKNIFLIHAHGAPLHNVAFSEAAAFVSERYNVQMVNITSLVFATGFFSPTVMEQYLGQGWEERIGFEGHAGAGETSGNLYLRGDLVKTEYKNLPPFIAKDLGEFLRTYERAGWQGYWGDPASGSKEMGKELIEDFVERHFRIAVKALAGEDLSQLPVYPDSFAAIAEAEVFVKDSKERYAQHTAEIEAWLKKRP